MTYSTTEKYLYCSEI